MSFVLPPASHLTASPLGVQRRVARAQALSDDAAFGPTGMHASSRAQPLPIPSAASAAAATSHLGAPPRAAAPASSFSSYSSSAAPRPSMGLFAHHPAAALHSAAFPHSDPSSLLSEDRLPLTLSAPSADLAKIYSFMDEAQSRTRDLESAVELQKVLNRALLISASEELIALQTQMDQVAYENACMAHELAALAADNRTMAARAGGSAIDGAGSEAAAAAAADDSAQNTLTRTIPAVRHTSLGSSRDAVSSASHYTNSPRFEGLTISSRPPSQPLQQQQQQQHAQS